jgi:integrase
VGTNIVEMRAGRERRVHLCFSQHEVKNGIDLDFLLPARTVGLVDEYNRRALPVLRRGNRGYLFPGEGNRHKQFGLLRTQLAAFTEREIGVRLTAHQFRHLAGYLYLKATPSGHEVVRQLLGHRSIQTTIQSYAGMEVSAAIAQYDSHISKQRKLFTNSFPRRQKTGAVRVSKVV